eukprot:GHVR01112397.1.p2 GENE.GHVR01112397.1~~GHVR01112397.1.p2  ORF type:complete len:152 (+),score=33.76 GHVR01112397.1:532-987(+)
MTDRPYMVIYPRGDRTILTTAYVRFYQKDEWDLASEEGFELEEEAHAHARALARKHGLRLSTEVPMVLDNEPGVEGEGMKLYAWRSKFMADYYNGQILAMATSRDAAADLVRLQVDAEMHPDEAMKYLLEKDLAAEPEVKERGVALIRGSS